VAELYVPDLNKLHPVGYRAIWIEKNENKLASKTLTGVYISYTRSGYKLFNPVTKRVLIRRDVWFRDDIFPLLIDILVLAVSTLLKRAVFEALNSLQGSN